MTDGEGGWAAAGTDVHRDGDGVRVGAVEHPART